MARRGPAPSGKKRWKKEKSAEAPMRKCIVSGAEKPKTELIRFVVGPDGTVVPDLEAKLPGRGLWLSAERGVVNTACAKRLFAKAARGKALAPDDLADQLKGLLTERCLALLGMARRSGAVVSGYEKVRDWLEEDKAGLLMAARDGADGGRRKMRNLAPELTEWDQLSVDELGRALGKETVVHVAVARGKLAERLAGELRRLDGFIEPNDAAA